VSANFAVSFLGMASLLLMLGACSDDTLPKWISGEPSQAEIDSYSGAITMPQAPGDEEAYPNLADVPARPKAILSPAQRQEEMESLKQENLEGQEAIRKYNTPQPPRIKK
jgi:hypothetical protein